jgi:hypothetical protein
MQVDGDDTENANIHYKVRKCNYKFIGNVMTM